jgi:hypothetical protein
MAIGAGALLAALTIDLVSVSLSKGHFYPLAIGMIETDPYPMPNSTFPGVCESSGFVLIHPPVHSVLNPFKLVEEQPTNTIVIAIHTNIIIYLLNLLK